MPSNELKEFLDVKAEFYEQAHFLEEDPIQLPHRFHRKEDIEIIAFIVSMIAWGNRKSIVKSGERIIEIMGNSPYDFIQSYKGEIPSKFVHRTFNNEDLGGFFSCLHRLYQHEGLEGAFAKKEASDDLKLRISHFRSIFFEGVHLARTQKHVSNPATGSASKRLVMFLRWMVRSSAKGVDFGLWKSISPAELMVPLDVHTGNVARKLGLLTRTQNDWKTNEELIDILRSFDASDPAKYDFALFGLGAYEGF
ncbi:MAG: TIGR02757 family protein [Flavobacteriales bacterium]